MGRYTPIGLLATSENQETLISHVDGIESLLTTIDSDTSILAGVVSGSEMQVDVVTMPTTTVTATDLDVRDLSSSQDSILMYGSDDGGTTKRVIKTDSGGALQVDLEISSVSITSFPDNEPFNLAQVGGTAVSVNSGVLDNGTQRVTIATNDEVNNLLGTIDADTSTLAGAVSGTEMQVDIVSSAALDVSAATVTVDLGANNDVVCAGNVAHDSGDSGNPVKIGGKAYNFDGTAPGTAVAENDRANFICDVYGRQFVETAHPNRNWARDNQSSAQTNTQLVAAPGAGLRIYITDIIISNGDTVGNIKLVEDTAGTPIDIVEVMYFGVNGGCTSNLRTPIPLTANKNLGYTSVDCTTHSINIGYYIAP
jgi:hypothetical protein